MKKYITTPIYYVNDVPHIGHAYTTVAADVLARYYKSKGEDVFFLTGTDEHGAKIAEAACRAGKSPQEYVDELAPQFEKAWKALGIESSQFFRTTNPKHEEIVKSFVKNLAEKGFIEKRKYEGLYCVGCEKYLTESDLVDGKCPDHKKEPVKQSEENYFFLLSKFQDRLIEIIKNDQLLISPKYRKNEILGKLAQGLEDVSISRENVEWGIGFPGDESQTIYVWVDALINYYSATKIYEVESWENHPADIHLMAKDILWFHAVIWPAMLLALDLPLPKQVFAHGFFTIAGVKMSKTIGNVLDPNKLVQKFGADAVRYALLREFPFGEDGDISEEKIERRYSKELAGGLGNLISRVSAMVEKYFDGKVPEVTKDPETHPLRLSNEIYNWKQTYSDFDKAIVDLKLYDCTIAIEKLVNSANKYIEDKKPWVLANVDKDELAWAIYGLCDAIVQIAWLVNPILPNISVKIAEAFKVEGLLKENPNIEESYSNIKAGTIIVKPNQLFPRLED